MRGLRQIVLLYGALAIGAALASALMLIAAESWRPLQLGETKPPGWILTAIRQEDTLWVAAWLALTVSLGLLIRWLGRPLASLIALGTIGVTAGGGIGLLAGRGLERLLDGTAAWDTLSAQATGVVLVEGALALLGAIFVGYWLLVWAIGKLPPSVLLAIMALTLMLAVAAVGSLIGGRRRWRWPRSPSSRPWAGRGCGGGAQRSLPVRQAHRRGPFQMGAAGRTPARRR